MQPDIANVVHPVLAYGLRLKQMADDREPFDLDQEQAAVKKLLLTDPEARRWTDYGGEGGAGGPQDSLLGLKGAAAGGTAGRRWGEQFLGIHYLLVCWLDEIMVD